MISEAALAIGVAISVGPRIALAVLSILCEDPPAVCGVRCGPSQPRSGVGCLPYCTFRHVVSRTAPSSFGELLRAFDGASEGTAAMSVPNFGWRVPSVRFQPLTPTCTFQEVALRHRASQRGAHNGQLEDDRRAMIERNRGPNRDDSNRRLRPFKCGRKSEGRAEAQQP
jgi:hypothetical protein